jgi:type I restriction enzyme M protein
MNAQTLIAKVWNFAHVLRDQGVSYQAYISAPSTLDRPVHAPGEA